MKSLLNNDVRLFVDPITGIAEDTALTDSFTNNDLLTGGTGVSLQTVKEPLQTAQNLLKGFATAPDFGAKMQVAFGNSFNIVSADALAKAWVAGDFSSFPKIEIRNSAEINGALGAFAGATNTIYLSREFLTQNAANTEAVASVLLEEIGHAVDTQLNNADTPGDEGAIFSSLVQGKTFEPQQLQLLKAKDDTATITLDGQIVQIEQAQPVSESGTKGGNKKKVFTLDPLPQGITERNVTLTFQYEHFSIPDQFELSYGTTPLFSTQKVVSGSKTDTVVVKQVQGRDTVDIKVTADTAGTAWNFTVSDKTAEINVDGKLGDVIKIDLGKQKGNLALKSLPDASKGKLIDEKGENATIDEKGENATVGTTYKILYYVPKVTGAIQTYGQDRSGDLGLGQVTFDVEDQDQKSLNVKVSVTDGFSTSGDNKVTIGTDKIDFYRQQQRLAYLGFPNSSGSPLVVDGLTGGNTNWATQLFNIVVDERTLSQRGRISGQSKTLKAYINSTNAPEWVSLNRIQNFTFVGTQRRFGANFSGDVIQGATTTVGKNLQSTGVSGRKGSGDPSTTHDGGRGVDIDTPGREIYANSTPNGQLFFAERQINGTWYVATANNQIIISDGNVYRAGNPNNNADLNRGLTTANLITNANTRNDNRQYDGGTILPQIANLLVNNAGYNLQNAINIINAFEGQGVQEILFNDPRTWTDGARFSRGHWGHIHFEVPVPAQAALLQGQRSFQVIPFSNSIIEEDLVNTVSFNNSSSLLDAIDLGAVEGNLNLTGLINSADPEQYYRLVLGTPVSESEIEGDYYLTLRNLSLLVNGLSNDVDIELIRDYNEDGVRQDDEVITSSEEIGSSPESINLTDLPENIYYIRVFQKSGDTTYNLALTVPPLPVPSDIAGNTPNNAQDLGILNGNITRSDFIGAVDSDDYYRFSLDKISDFSAQVNGLDQGNLVVYLGKDLNNDATIDFDEIIAISEETEGNEPGAININGLATGNYYVWLSRISGNTDYNLNLSATPSVIPADKAGSTLATAFNLNTASTQSDFVGNVDPTDYYRFTLTNPSGVTLKLSGLSADADLELSQDKNADGVISSDEVIQLSEEIDNQDENINLAALPAGDYFVKVSQYDGDTNYSLELTPTTASGVDLEVTVTPVATPLTLGDQVSYTVTVKNIGASNATGVTLNDNLPLESILDVSAVVSKGTRSISGNEITANIGSLNVNESATVVVSGRLVGSGSTSSLIQASSAESDFNPDNDSVVQRFNVAPGTIQPADLELSLTSDKTTANIDDIVTLRITLTNKGIGAATSIKVKQVLAQGLTFVSSSPQQGSYDSVSGIWDAGNVAKDNQAFLDIVAKVTSGGVLSATAEVIELAETDPDSTPNNNNPNEDDQVSITLNAIGDSAAPTIQVTSPATDITDQNVTINYNAFDADSNAKVSLFYDTDNQGFDGILIANNLEEKDGNGSFNWNTEGIPTGDYYVYAMVVDENNPPVFSYSPGKVRVTEAADLSVTKTANADPVVVGNNLTYSIAVTNNGANNARGVTLTDTLPEGVQLVSTSINPIQQSGNQLTFDLANFNAGETKTVTLTITPPTTGNITGSASVTSKTFDPVATNDIAVLTTSVNPISTDLSISATPLPSTVNLGDKLTYNFTVTNNSPTKATGVTLTDILPSEIRTGEKQNGESEVVIISSKGLASQTKGVVTAELGELNSGESATVTITAASIAAGTFINTASVTSNEADSNPANNSLIQRTTVNPVTPTLADLELTKIVDKANPNVIVAQVNNAGIIPTTAAVTAVSEADPDSTPNNNNPNEDDQASVTINAIGGVQIGTSTTLVFDDKTYLSQYPDVRDAYNNGGFEKVFDHFTTHGILENRDLRVRLFDETYYLAQNTDIKQAVDAGGFDRAFEHFILWGLNEGRKGSSSDNSSYRLLFDENYYLGQNPEVKAAVDAGDLYSGLIQYFDFGQFEGRKISASENYLISV